MRRGNPGDCSSRSSLPYAVGGGHSNMAPAHPPLQGGIMPTDASHQVSPWPQGPSQGKSHDVSSQSTTNQIVTSHLVSSQFGRVYEQHVQALDLDYRRWQGDITKLQQHLQQRQASVDQHSPKQQSSQTPQFTYGAAPTVSNPVSNKVYSACVWSKHMSPDNVNEFYYNNVTGESTWLKPQVLTDFEQQQKPSVHHLQTHP